MPTPRLHGSTIRGLDTTPRASSFEGVFGRMFRTLLPAFPPATNDLTILKAFEDLAKKMTAEAEDVPTAETQLDDEENQGINAGYTYLGQFIDHDLTYPIQNILLGRYTKMRRCFVRWQFATVNLTKQV